MRSHIGREISQFAMVHLISDVDCAWNCHQPKQLFERGYFAARVGESSNVVMRLICPTCQASARNLLRSDFREWSVGPAKSGAAERRPDGRFEGNSGSNELQIARRKFN
jgi:hypothetical protein